MRYLTLGEVIHLHDATIRQSGGGTGVRDLPAGSLSRDELTDWIRDHMIEFTGP